MAAGSGVCASEYSEKEADTCDWRTKHAAAHVKWPQTQIKGCPMDGTGVFTPQLANTAAVRAYMAIPFGCGRKTAKQFCFKSTDLFSRECASYVGVLSAT
jgi:hypothetical protein